VQTQMFAKAFAQVSRRQSAPGYVGNITGNVIKSAGVDVRLMRKRQKRDARSNAGAEYADAFVTLIFQPPHRGARVEHSLAHRLNRATDVSTYQVIGALEFRWPARFVIRKRQAERRHADEIKDPASFNVTVRLR